MIFGAHVYKVLRISRWQHKHTVLLNSCAYRSRTNEVVPYQGVKMRADFYPNAYSRLEGGFQNQEDNDNFYLYLGQVEVQYLRDC